MSTAEAEEREAAPEENEDAPELDTAWYVVNTFSGYERKARIALEERIRSLQMEDWFEEILVPEEQVVERTSAGKTRQRSKRFYPGYILVKMHLDNESWHVVTNTAKVTGFVGNARRPPRVPQHEVDKILGLMQDGATEVKPRLEFDKGEAVRVIEGPFANFNGVVEEVRPDKGKLIVSVSIFGRATPVELDFTQVQKS